MRKEGEEETMELDDDEEVKGEKRCDEKETRMEKRKRGMTGMWGGRKG